ncbi:MAG: hypothetical protein REJ50_15525 [Bordetella sp.]|nr:hypothetical protein [Bordetella sp.]
MNTSSVEAIGRPRIDTLQNPYLEERVRAQMRAERLEYAHVAARMGAEATQAACVVIPYTSHSQAGEGAGPSVDALRNDFAAHCLQRAIQAFHEQLARLDARAAEVDHAARDEQSLLQARAAAAQDLGTIEGLSSLQPYRSAAVWPTLSTPGPEAVFGSGALRVTAVDASASLRGSTDRSPRPTMPVVAEHRKNAV